MLHRLILAAALAVGLSSVAQAQVADVVQVCGAASGVVTPLGPGGHLTRDVNGSLCIVTSGATTANQGTAAPDVPANRWPVLAYQGGTWSVGLNAGVSVLADLRVAGNPVAAGNPVSVSGTVAATQSGTWTLNQGSGGTSPWAQQLYQGGNAVSSSNPTFVSVTNGMAGSVTAPGTNGTAAQAVQGISGGVPLAAIEVDGANATIGAKADAAYTGSGTASVVALLKGQYGALLAATPAAVTAAAPSYATGTTQALSLTTAGALRTDGSATTQPVSAAVLPLPAGAATSAAQTSVQSAPGTAAGTLLGIQGSASGVPVPVSVSAGAPYTYTVSALGASGTASSNIYNTSIAAQGNPLPYAYYTCSAFADQVGTLFIEDSLDATTFYPRNGTAGTALAANANADVKVPITKNVTRCRYVNGATAQTKFFLAGTPTRY